MFKVPLETTSNKDLRKIVDAMGMDLEIHSVDLLPSTIDPNMNYIINADVVSGPGTHWTALHTGGKYNVIYDPFGVPPDTRIKAFAKSGNNDLVVSIDKQSQHIDASSCGYWCIWFLYQREKGKSLGEIVSMIEDDEKKNEKMLERFFLG